MVDTDPFPDTPVPMTEESAALCDFDADGNCDSSDYAVFVGSLGHCVGDLEYIPIADVDGDECITVTDEEILYAPEPSRWLMLVAGTAFLGVLYRRRTRGLRLG
jgi:hypothetical protein